MFGKEARFQVSLWQGLSTRQKVATSSGIERNNTKTLPSKADGGLGVLLPSGGLLLTESMRGNRRNPEQRSVEHLQSQHQRRATGQIEAKILACKSGQGKG